MSHKTPYPASPESTLNHRAVPSPRSTIDHELGRYRDVGTIDEIATTVLKDVCVIDNYSVFAVGGNAYNENTPRRFRDVKGEGRGEKTLGLILPHTHRLIEGIYDTSKIENRALKKLLEDPEKLDAYFGAGFFLRGPVNRALANARDIPECVISDPDSRPSGDPIDYEEIQPYSPVGNPAAQALAEAVADSRGLLVMTSANESGLPEIVSEAAAREFAQKRNLPIFVHLDARREFVSSYPILRATKLGFFVVMRTGFLGRELIEDVVKPTGIPLIFDRNLPKPSYEEKVLHRHHLKDAGTADGAELLSHILRAIGVTTG